MVFRHIAKFWKKALYFVITGSTSVFIAACYGIPLAVQDLGKWVIRVHDDENNPIRGLQVTILQFVGESDSSNIVDIGETDSTGTCSLDLVGYDESATYRHQAIIEDRDSTENGGFFADTTIDKTAADVSDVTARRKQ